MLMQWPPFFVSTLTIDSFVFGVFTDMIETSLEQSFEFKIKMNTI